MPGTALSTSRTIQKTKIPPGPAGHWLYGSLPEIQHNPLKFLLSTSMK